jgi:hypothetical protein
VADLRVTDAIVADSQQGFGAAAAHLEPVAQGVQRLGTAPAGAQVMTDGLADQDVQLAVLLATARQCLSWLAQATAQAGQQFSGTDQALGRTVTEAGR